jgi:hypothetical protein
VIDAIVAQLKTGYNKPKDWSSACGFMVRAPSGQATFASRHNISNRTQYMARVPCQDILVGAAKARVARPPGCMRRRFTARRWWTVSSPWCRRSGTISTAIRMWKLCISKKMRHPTWWEIISARTADHGPRDLIYAFNQACEAPHVFWTHLIGTQTVNGGTAPGAAKWLNLAGVCAANSLRNTAYPANCP